MYKDYGAYPENTAFDGFSLNYEQNLAMFNNGEKYFYTNSTTVNPANASTLSRIAGHGTSPIVGYNGTGAYFLDQLESGVWRLEVMPDVLITGNPYGRNSLEKKIAVVQWNKNRMEINLDDLGKDFRIKPLNDGNNHAPEVSGGKFVIAPGVYLITKAGVKTVWDAQDTWGNIKLHEFHAPASSVDKTYVVHKKVDFAIAEEPLSIEAQVISHDPDITVQIQVTSGFDWKLIDMERKNGFTYIAQIPREQMRQGFLTYYILVKSKEKVETFPAGKPGLPYYWDFYDRNPYTVRVIEKNQPIYLFNAQEDWTGLSYTWWSRDSKLVPTDQWNESEYQVRITDLFQPDEENLNGPVIHDYSLRYYVNEKINHLRGQLSGKQTLVIKARSLEAGPKSVQVALVTKDGSAYGKVIELGTAMQEVEIPLSELTPVKLVTMPRPYPTFLPYYFFIEKDSRIKVEDIEGIQISIGPGIAVARRTGGHRVGIVGLMLK